MRRMTARLPDELDARLRHEAERQGTTTAEIVRKALEQYLGSQAGNVWHSGQRDVSERIEEIATLDRRHFSSISSG